MMNQQYYTLDCFVQRQGSEERIPVTVKTVNVQVPEVGDPLLLKGVGEEDFEVVERIGEGAIPWRNESDGFHVSLNSWVATKDITLVVRPRKRGHTARVRF